MGVPYELVDLAIALAVTASLVVFRRAPSRGTATPQNRPNDTTRRPGGVRAASIALVATVFVGAFVFRAAGAPLLPSDQPLVFGNAWGGDDPLLLSVGNGPGGQLVYAYAPGGSFRTGIVLANNGNVPLSVTGLDPSPNSYVSSLEFRLPPGAPSADLPWVNPGASPTWTSEPFRPFEIAAHGLVGLGLQVGLATCRDVTAVPTLGPGATLPVATTDLGTGFTAVDTLHVRYTALGIARTAVVLLPEALDVATNTGQPVECQPD